MNNHSFLSIFFKGEIMSETVVNQETNEFSGALPVLFKFGLKALIQAKSDALIILRELELELLNAKHDLAEKERTIFLTTDFKELGLTNEKMRSAYVNEKLSDYKIKMDVQKHRITSKKDDIEIINDLIELRALEMKGE